MKKIILFILLIGIVPGLWAQDFDFAVNFKQKAAVYFPEAVELRRSLHQIPELCHLEKETSGFVTRYLRKLGLTVHTGIGGYGLKAVLKGGLPGPVIAIRADMDALPLQEKTGLPFTSKNSGVMHACGHDAHMTNVLLAVKLLAEVKDKIPGAIVFIFQPCEEGAPLGKTGGAQGMIEAGVLENPHIDAILGLHVLPDLPVGTIGVCPGPIMANVASFYIKIFGKASHGAFPHQGIDAIYVASSAIMQFQSLISRFRDPNEPAVLTVGKIKGGVRLNVIAEKVELEGTVRTFSFEFQNKISMGMEKILKAHSISYGTKYSFDFIKDAPFVKNDPTLTEFILPVFKKILGQKNVRIVKPMTIAEDFSHYSHKIPALFFFLGAGGKSALHTPTFAVDEEALKIGPALFASAAFHYLQSFPKK
jgi:amidohydrolase